ncbi:tyrosine-type recombinase/integrase [Nocardia sp. NPDC049707]|uniref:tyrosine-type recombinase/integrase n=1 Tax=Nocardia sp. NPDC049707 TaxID=3154735 RepID=UPI00341D589C
MDEAIEYDAQHSLKSAKGSLSGRSPRFTVAEAIDEWAEVQAADEGTVSVYLGLLQPVKDAHGDLPVRKLHDVQISRLAKQLHAGTFPYVSPAGNKRDPWCAALVNKMLSRLTAVLERLRNQGFTDHNAAASVPRMSTKRTAVASATKRETFTLDEVAVILNAAVARGLNLFIVCLLAFLGLRKGEIGGLEWDRVDLKNGRMWVLEQRKRNRRNKSERAEGEGATLTDAVKTEASARELPIPPTVVAVLKLVRQWQREMHLATGKRWGVDGGLPTHVVVNQRTGGPVCSDYAWYRWAELVTKLPVVYLTLHKARKTCGTQLALQPGIGPHHVGAWLGHEAQGSIASPVTGVYIDADDEFRQAACEAWEVVFGPIVTLCDTPGVYQRVKAQLSA